MAIDTARRFERARVGTGVPRAVIPSSIPWSLSANGIPSISRRSTAKSARPADDLSAGRFCPSRLVTRNAWVHSTLATTRVNSPRSNWTLAVSSTSLVNLRNAGRTRIRRSATVMPSGRTADGSRRAGPRTYSRFGPRAAKPWCTSMLSSRCAVDRPTSRLRATELTCRTSPDCRRRTSLRALSTEAKAYRGLFCITEIYTSQQRTSEPQRRNR